MKELELQENLFSKFKALSGYFPCFITFTESYSKEVCEYLEKCHIKYLCYNGLDYDGIYKYFIRILD